MIINPEQFGVSFSVKQCRSFGIDPKATLDWLIQTMGFRRFRLMSYWNEHEKEQGKYDFTSLDWQIKKVAEAGGIITLCLGARQPRWPENHWPEWAWELSKQDREQALLAYIRTVVECYKTVRPIQSYQLENEALLAAFGERPEVDRQRLRQEYQLVKQLDPHRPIAMSTSTSWGIPLRKPIPDIIGFSYYRIVHGKRGYSKALHGPLLHRTRKRLIALLQRKPVFIHELQLEPWGPTAIWKMPIEEQDKSMSTAHIHKNMQLAKRTKLYPIDLWGGEWWYWRRTQHNDATVADAVLAAIYPKGREEKGV